MLLFIEVWGNCLLQWRVHASTLRTNNIVWPDWRKNHTLMSKIR